VTSWSDARLSCDWPGHGEPSSPCHAVLLARLAEGVAKD
jgi:hypothetical protein